MTDYNEIIKQIKEKLGSEADQLMAERMLERLEACGEITFDEHSGYRFAEREPQDAEVIWNRELQALIESGEDLPNSAPAIAAIEAGLAAGGDEEDWEAPEFEAAREATQEMGISWDFDGWEDTLTMLRNGKIGGTEVSAR